MNRKPVLISFSCREHGRTYSTNLRSSAKKHVRVESKGFRLSCVTLRMTEFIDLVYRLVLQISGKHKFFGNWM
jgi:hypothetical protein